MSPPTSVNIPLADCSILSLPITIQAQFELICYSDVEKPDAFTDRFRSQSTLFRETRQMNDAQLSEQIRSDQLDILVDLSAHMAKNRMLVFARRSAPVQISYLAYPFTTGLSTMDWLVTDRYLDPPLGTGHYHIERLLYLPHSYWCYSPPPSSPKLTPLPAQTKGFITFGSLNNFVKMNQDVWQLWAAHPQLRPKLPPSPPDPRHSNRQRIRPKQPRRRRP